MPKLSKNGLIPPYVTTEDGHCVLFVPTNHAVDTCKEIQLFVDNVRHRQNIRVNPRWRGVEYHAELFPGEIKQLRDGNYEVSILNRVGTI